MDGSYEDESLTRNSEAQYSNHSALASANDVSLPNKKIP